MNHLAQRALGLGVALACAVVIVIVIGAAGCDACEPYSATDKEKGLRELRRIEQFYSRNRLPIELRDAVGCNVCPYECRIVDLTLRPLEELVIDFLELAVVYPKHFSSDLNTKAHQIACIFLRHGAVGKERLIGRIHDDLPEVRFLAAYLAVEFNLMPEEEVMPVFRSLLDHPDQDLRILAKMQIDDQWVRDRRRAHGLPVHRRPPPPF